LTCFAAFNLEIAMIAGRILRMRILPDAAVAGRAMQRIMNRSAESLDVNCEREDFTTGQSVAQTASCVTAKTADIVSLGSSGGSSKGNP
jgi:hypothetical protein